MPAIWIEIASHESDIVDNQFSTNCCPRDECTDQEWVLSGLQPKEARFRQASTFFENTLL